MDVPKRIIYILLFLLIASSQGSRIVDASKTMVIEVNQTTIFSGDLFSASIYDPTIKNETPYLTNVIFIFNEETYQIPLDDESGEILIKAPYVLVNTTCVIEAYKEGYDPANMTLHILAKEPEPSFDLHITLLDDEKDIKSFQEFTILVTDVYGTPIQGATVYTQESNNKEQFFITDLDGTATLTAPNYDEITIITNKTGYEPGQLVISVTTQPTITDELLNHPYTPIALSVLFLITVIIYVTRKNKVHTDKIFGRHSKNAKETMKHQDTNNTREKIMTQSFEKNNDRTMIQERKNPKIEEIHIPSDTMTKEIISFRENTKNKENKTFETHRWFENTSDVEKKVDTLKEPMKNENTEKWFIGTDNLRKKIDDTIQEKDKKQTRKRYGSN